MKYTDAQLLARIARERFISLREMHGPDHPDTVRARNESIARTADEDEARRNEGRTAVPLVRIHPNYLWDRGA